MKDPSSESDESKAEATSGQSDAMMLQGVLLVLVAIAGIAGEQLGLSVTWVIVTSGAAMLTITIVNFIRDRRSRRRWRLPEDMRPPQKR